MEAALRITGIFLLVDVLAAVSLLGLTLILSRRQPEDERASIGALLGVLTFLALSSLLIYGGIWLCLRG